MGIVILFILAFALPSRVYASVALNEFAVLPAQTVEIVNMSSESADISGWYLDDSGGSTFFTIEKNTIVAPYSCVVISGSFHLNSTSADSIRMFNNTYPPTSSSAALIDQYYYLRSSAVSYSIGKVPDGTGNWAERPQTFGQWNESGVSCLTPPLSPTPSLQPTLQPSPPHTSLESPTPTPYPEIYGVIISEVYPYPNTNEKEWVKIHNTNTFSVELAGWFIDDREDEGASPLQFTATIDSLSYGVIELSRSMLNNDGDAVRLLDSKGNEKDGFEYTKATKGQIIYIGKEVVSDLIPTVELQSPVEARTLTYRELKQIEVPYPKPAITYQPPFYAPSPQVEPQVLGITAYKEADSKTESHKIKCLILLIIPGVNSVLTIASLFIKMSHA